MSMIDLDALQDFVEKGRRIQAMLDEMGVGRQNDTTANGGGPQAKRRRHRRQTNGMPMFSRARVLGALEQGANNVGAIATTLGQADAAGRSRTSAVLTALKRDGLVRRRGRGKWGLTAAGQERVKA